MKRDNGNILLEILIIIAILAIIFWLAILGLNYLSITPNEIIDNIAFLEPKRQNLESKAIDSERNIVLSIGEEKIEENSNKKNEEGYYYSQLSSESKTIYDKLYENKDNLKTGNYKIDFGKTFNDLLNKENGADQLTQIFQSAWDAFSYDNMDVFYIDIQKFLLITESKTIFGKTTYYISVGSGDEGYLISDFSSKEQVDLALKYVDKNVNVIIENIKDYDTYTKVKYVHNWIIENIEYDTTLSKNNIRNIYGAVKNKEVVCEGYAKLFKYILDKLEIPCVLISGEAKNSTGKTESHAWNYVKLNNKWYAVDVTWDDPIIQGNGILRDSEKYKYFLKGSDEFMKDHKPDGKFVDNSMEFELPTLNKENYY